MWKNQMLTLKMKSQHDANVFRSKLNEAEHRLKMAHAEFERKRVASEKRQEDEIARIMEDQRKKALAETQANIERERAVNEKQQREEQERRKRHADLMAEYIKDRRSEQEEDEKRREEEGKA